MSANRNTYFTNKKIIVQFILSLFVFFIHFRVFSIFLSDGLVRSIFKPLQTLTHVAVPLFFIISGALFYHNYTLSSTIQKWKSRFWGLCVPYLIWNTLWLVLALLGYYTPLGGLLGGVKTAFSWDAVLSGIFLHRFFEPFWFILQLIVLTAACPIIYLFLRNKWIGLLSIVAFFILNCTGFSLNTTLSSNSSMVLFYLLGAWVGIHYFDAFTTRRSKKQAVIGIVVYIACCVFKGVTHLTPEWVTDLQIPLLITVFSCFSFWAAFDFFEMQKYPNYMTNSFLIYAMHSFVGAALSKIIYILLPDGELYTLLTAVVAFPATVIIICVFGGLLGKYFPRIKRILNGR